MKVRSGADSYRLLIDLGRATNSAPNLACALSSVWNILSSSCSCLAMNLEVAHPAIRATYTSGNCSLITDDLSAGHHKLLVPVISCGIEMGTLILVHPALTPLPIGLADVVAAHLGTRVELNLRRAENSLMAERLQRRVGEVAAIYEIGQAIDIEQIELPKLYQMITDRASELLEGQAASMMMFDEESRSLRVVACCGLGDDALGAEQPLGKGIAGRVALSDQPLLIVDGLDDPRLTGIAMRPDIGSSMLVPMKRPDGRLLGVLSIRRSISAPAFTGADLKLLCVFASQATLATTNLQLYEDVRKRAVELGALSTLSRSLISTIDVAQLLGNVADDIVNVVGMSRCCLYLLDHARHIYVPKVWRGYPDSIGRNPIRERESVLADVARERTTLYYNADRPVLAEEEQYKGNRQRRGFARSLGVNSFVAAPILNGKNECFGVVVADSRGQEPAITADRRQLLAAFVSQVGIAIDNALLYVRSKEDNYKIRRLTEYTENVLLSIPAGILSTDSRGRIVRWNRATEQTLALTPGALRGSLLSSVLRRIGVAEKDRSVLMDRLTEVLETGETVYQVSLNTGVEGEPRPRKTLKVNLSRISYHGEPHGVALSLEDVTREVSLRAQLESVQRLADIGQLAAKMAHEVRNALSPIKGAAQFIKAEIEGQGSGAEWPNIIIAEVEGLARLTSAMLDFARPTPLDLRSFSPFDFLLGCITPLSSFLADHKVLVAWKLDPALPDLTADPVQLGQAVRNLVMNAAQSMPDGGTLTISVAMDHSGQDIVMKFQDTGGGLLPDQYEKVFQPFVTTRPKGTGLGLPIVQKVMSNHGGRVYAESRPADGACFVLQLPLTIPDGCTETSLDAPPVISAESSRYPDN